MTCGLNTDVVRAVTYMVKPHVVPELLNAINSMQMQQLWPSQTIDGQQVINRYTNFLKHSRFRNRLCSHMSMYLRAPSNAPARWKLDLG